MSGPIFFPAMLSNRLRTYKKPARWWAEEGVWKYNNMLCSYGVADEKSDVYNFDTCRKEVFTMCDSGGFQKTKGIDVSAVGSIEWMSEYADVGLILDTPPYKVVGGAGSGVIPITEPAAFKRYLDKTIQDTRLFVKIIEEKKSDMELYGVAQGATDELMDQWFDALKQEYKFAGWAISINQYRGEEEMLNYLALLANRLARMYKLGIKKVHVLGLSTYPVCALLNYASPYFDRLSFDSRNQSAGGMFGKYWSPLTMRMEDDMSRKSGGAIFPIDNCPFCEEMERSVKVHPDFLDGHNLFTIVNMNKAIGGLLHMKNQDISVIKRLRLDKNTQLNLDLAVRSFFKQIGVSPIEYEKSVEEKVVEAVQESQSAGLSQWIK